jgi:hypothetical protein
MQRAHLSGGFSLARAEGVGECGTRGELACARCRRVSRADGAAVTRPALVGRGLEALNGTLLDAVRKKCVMRDFLSAVVLSSHSATIECGIGYIRAYLPREGMESRLRERQGMARARSPFQDMSGWQPTCRSSPCLPRLPCSAGGVLGACRCTWSRGCRCPLPAGWWHNPLSSRASVTPE